MTSNPRVTHSLVNVIIVILYLGGPVMYSEAEKTRDDRPRQDLSSNGAKTPQLANLSPADPYPLVGDTVYLNCTVKPSYPNIDVNAMHFLNKNKETIRNSELHILSNDTVQLIWRNVTMDQSGYIYCYMGDNILNGTNVNIGLMPPMLSDEDIDCVIYNGQSMNCTWCPKVIPLLTQWKSSFSIDGGKEYVNFRAPYTSICSSYWPSRAELLSSNNNHDTGDEFKMNFVYYLWVDTINAWSNYRDKNPKHIFELDTGKMNKVKPNKVDNLKVTAENSSCIKVTWERPPHLPSSVAVFYELNYTSEWENDTVHIDGPGVGLLVEHSLVHLHPDTQYDISVRCKPREEGYWSEQVSISKTTHEAAPSAPPEMVKGSYKTSPGCHSKNCDVTIMWKEIEKFNQNGDIRKYTLELMKGNKHIETINVAGDEYQITTSIDPSQIYSAKVRGQTDKGVSPSSVIPVIYDVKLEPTNVVAEIDENKTLVNVWWDRSSATKITSYTLFYCTQDTDDNRQPICGKGDLTSVTLRGNSTHARLPYSEDFMYSLAANADDSSSGMHEWLCLYIYEHAVPDVNFVFAEHQQERSLTIKITTNQACDAGNPSGRIVNYNLTIQCIHGDGSCPEAGSHLVDGSIKSHVFGNLKPYKEYDVTVTGVGNEHKRTMTQRHRTKESAPDSPPRNVSVDELDCHWINISWEEPPREHWNGKTLMYHVLYTEDGDKWLDVNTTKTWMFLSHEIYGHTNYFINVTASNSGGPSKPSKQLQAQTNICAPSKVAVTTADILNRSQVQITWEAPQHCNGPLKGYQITAFYETAGGLPANHSWKSSTDMVPAKFNIGCPADIEDYIVVNYTVQAITYNKMNGKQYLGPLSSSSSSFNKHMCKPASIYDNLPLAISVSLASAVALVLGIVACTCRHKWYPEFKSWLGGGVPEEPPVLRDMEKPDDLTSISTDPPYIDEWVQNLIVDLTPLIDEGSKDLEHDEDYMSSGESARSRIFIEGIPDGGRDNSGTSSSSTGELLPDTSEESTEYKKGQPDNMDEKSGLLNGESVNSIVDKSEPRGNENVAFINTEESCEELSESSGIQSGKVSETDSKSSSCASSGIGQGPLAAPIGTGLFALLTADDLRSSDSDDDDGYREVDMTGKSNGTKNLTQFESEDANYGTSNINSGDETTFPASIHNPSHINVSDSLEIDHSERDKLVNGACTHCLKRHEPHIKCCLSSPELCSYRRNRENRVDSSCSDESSIPLDILSSSPSDPADFSLDTAPCINSKLQTMLV